MIKHQKFFITGGAGFIGSNLAMRLLKSGNYVTIFDNLSRKGSEENLKWLKSENNGTLNVIINDIRNKKALEESIPHHNIIYHTAAQVSADTSIQNPVDDFEININGTLNILEVIRKSPKNKILIHISTNKVYRPVEKDKIIERKLRYSLKNISGLNENEYLEFFSPYGCSKGAADQYVNDYHRVFNLNTVVLRQSAIYGPRQFGKEEQGWIAHIYKQALSDKLVKIFGNGKQVRDILFIDDLIDAYFKVVENIKITNGQSYNIGGGLKNSLSILEFINFLEKRLNKKIKKKFVDWRPADQRIFISNCLKAKKDFNWEPKINYQTGLIFLENWLKEIKM
ncbi:MAG: GDP-mannose 4,6-dehydratase [Candidatus Pacebacteria bacterium]|nr:GDP-mannose 4,6-dehydratase [Candidatus Paceibacterota bacterium]